MGANFSIFICVFRCLFRHGVRNDIFKFHTVPLFLVLCLVMPNTPYGKENVVSADGAQHWTRPNVALSRKLMTQNDLDDYYEEDAYSVPIDAEEEEADDASLINYCTLISPCTACTDTDRSDIAECSSTGRIETYRCVKVRKEESAPYILRSVADVSYYDEPSEQQQRGISYRSCAWTKTEQEFMFIQFQVFCGLVGCISVYSIRKQKMVVATLFDQRRMNQAPNPRRIRVNDNNNEGIEMKTTRSSNPTTQRQLSSVHSNNSSEMKSLLSSSNPVNVV